MDKRSKIALNEQVVEQIEEAYKGLEVSEPQIDINSDLKSYVDSLEFEEEHERETKVDGWIKKTVGAILTKWAAIYAPNSQLLKQANDEISKLSTLKSKEQNNIDSLGTKIADKREEKRIKRDIINSHKLRVIDNQKIDLSEEKKKAMIALFFSFVIAIGTYMYFMHTQINIKWSTMAKTEKVSQVKEMLLGGALNQYSAFEAKIRIDDTTDETIPLDAITLKDLGGITVENIHLAPKPTIMQAVLYDPSLLSLAFISFILIMFGKITAILYEKLTYPRWMYISLWILLAVTMLSAIMSVSYLEGKQIVKSSLVDQSQSIELKIKNIRDSQIAGFGGDLDTDTSKDKTPEIINKLEREGKELRDRLSEVTNDIGSFKTIMMILFFLSEIFVGSLGWISYAEYIEKRMRVSIDGGGELTHLENELDEIENDIRELEQNVEESEGKISKATDLESRLKSIQKNLFSTAKMNELRQEHLDQALAQGELVLQNAIHSWKKAEKV